MTNYIFEKWESEVERRDISVGNLMLLPCICHKVAENVEMLQKYKKQNKNYVEREKVYVSVSGGSIERLNDRYLSEFCLEIRFLTFATLDTRVLFNLYYLSICGYIFRVLFSTSTFSTKSCQ